MSIEQWVTFALAALIVLGLPGPANLAVSSYALQRSRIAVVASILGTALGGSAIMVAALAGLIALIGLSPDAFSTLQWISGVYIVVLLIRLVRGPIARPPFADNDNLPERNPARVLLRSLVAVALDPKAAVLCTALFAQLVDALRPDLANTSVFAAIFFIASLLAASVYALFAAKIRSEIRTICVRSPVRKTNGKTRIGGGKVAYGYRPMAA